MDISLVSNSWSNGNTIEEVLKRSKKHAVVTDTTVGPTTVTYALSPGYGVKLSDVHALSNDIARAISVQSVRVLSLEGSNSIMIEVPRQKRETILLNNILKTPQFTNTDFTLPLVLGVDTQNSLLITDLVKAPHLLIGGTTGSGKSVGLNAMISSLIISKSPEQLQFIMIDPKVVELGIYEGIGHLYEPIHTDVYSAETALLRAVQEMDQRYHKFKELGIKNISSYTKNEMPYLVVVVDELADLLQKDPAMTSDEKKTVASCASHLRRLTQKGRACGIHVIAATQRPTTDVLSGTMKSNFGTRISFLMADARNSITIIDEGGAETLLGMGDFLYKRTDGNIIRIQAPYISEKDLDQLIKNTPGFGTKTFEIATNQPSKINSENSDNYIYVLGNPSLFHDGKPLYKIGSTSDLEGRVSQLSRITSLPTKFEMICWVEIDNAHDIEKRLHKHFKEYRRTGNREFFSADIEQIVNKLGEYGSVQYPG